MNKGNPLIWNCEADGCFNTIKRPKIEIFADCFAHGINLEVLKKFIRAWFTCADSPRAATPDGA